MSFCKMPFVFTFIQTYFGRYAQMATSGCIFFNTNIEQWATFTCCEMQCKCNQRLVTVKLIHLCEPCLKYINFHRSLMELHKARQGYNTLLTGSSSIHYVTNSWTTRLNSGQRLLSGLSACCLRA